ncbi:flagellar basal body protein [Pseudemcibacter aquimaris]|uniref:flagellar basal body protein n=1 Tax=Pseudemcibacter aquimaris TaxID=2857064 RepID=UPI0020121390|nr:flagellar basal body protein [Pseudemcibacter aquimaris]MCC3862222.1 flagellar basal body protein [Pseudemcibacter aquimaris]WDU58974.1 flagellar basal body protein [Pseudemcibacter aquimaris]
MSLYASLFSGVSGLAANSSAMGMISDNIVNINTVGYKGTQAKFSSLVTESNSTASYSPGGVQAKPQALISQQGLL